MTIKSSISKILHIGIFEGESRRDSFRKILTNSISMIGVVINFVVFSIYVFINLRFSLIYLFTTFLFTIPLILSYKGFHKTASLVVLTFNAIVIFGMSFIGGFSIGIHPLLILITFCGAILFLSFFQAFLFNIILLCTFFILKKYSNEIGPMIESELFSIREYLNFSIAIISSFILARFILNNVLKYISTLETTLDDLKESNRKMASQNQRLELFNTIASHDLKTPLRNFTSFVSLAKRHVATEKKTPNPLNI